VTERCHWGESAHRRESHDLTPGIRAILAEPRSSPAIVDVRSK
jgi:hypothetical protein